MEVLTNLFVVIIFTMYICISVHLKLKKCYMSIKLGKKKLYEKNSK